MARPPKAEREKYEKVMVSIPPELHRIVKTLANDMFFGRYSTAIAHVIQVYKNETLEGQDYAAKVRDTGEGDDRTS